MSDWPLAMRFAALIIPFGVLIVLAGTWLGYKAASVTLHESIETVPLLEARVQAERTQQTLRELRDSLVRIAQSDQIIAQTLHQNISLFFQNNTELVREIGFKSRSGGGFLLLRDDRGFKELGLAEASIGPYSPFQQINTQTLRPGAASLYPVVYFDDPGETKERAGREPVMRMALELEDGSGILVLGISVEDLQQRLATLMQPGSAMQSAAKDGNVQLAFYFDVRGWIIFEMNGVKGKSFLPDLSRQGYTGDLGRAGYDAAFRPWAAHEDYWHMVTEVMDGRYGSKEAPSGKYISAQMGASGYLCFAPVFFSPSADAPSLVVGGLAFFETSSLPMAAFFRFANYSMAVIVASILLFIVLAFCVSRKLASPIRRMAHELSRMSESGELAFVGGDPASEEQQKLQAAVNSIISGALSTQNDLQRLNREMHNARSRLPVDLHQPLAKPLPEAEFGLVGSSALIREVRDLVHKAAKAGTDVLVWGETGTGKELIAAAIHKAGSRSKGPYISINCGALDENLLLDALFGHVKGAFTEAKGDRKGAFLAADGGTLHLDEIANASLKVQQALLRALSVRRIRPLGTDEEIPFNTRVVAATNVDLRECVRAGTFREDLYYRLAIISIESPPLRHRKEDIPELAAFCIHEAAQTLGRGEARLSRGALEVMAAYDWPGNVREFKNCLTRAMAFVEGDLILRQHISLEQDAFRTYAKPLAPKVLAEKLLQPEPRRASQAAPPAGERGQASGLPAGPLERDSAFSGPEHVAEQIWPAPPRDSFTPALQQDGTQAKEQQRPQAKQDAAPTQAGAPLPESMRAFAERGAEQGFSAAYVIGQSSIIPFPQTGAVAPPYTDGRDSAARSGSNDGSRAGSPPAFVQGDWTGARPAATAPLASSAERLYQAGTQLNERQALALSYINEQGQITRAQYEDVAGKGVSARTAQNDLRELVDMGILTRIGAGPGTRYVLIKRAQ
ncbi:sigma 54-interacting transcriptional regulator [Desulfovibrio sp. OttesenSCG-928-A18]|nr:sigma 54-interacting transcriptional regulator [Desulfovibrio sp. OttesenSCG-928-A18]